MQLVNFWFETQAISKGLSTVMITYGILMSIGTILGLILPETKDKEIPDTIEEAENTNKIELKIFGKKKLEIT